MIKKIIIIAFSVALGLSMLDGLLGTEDSLKSATEDAIKDRVQYLQIRDY